MAALTHQQKQTINAKIREIEGQTSAELVTIICQKSDDYHYIPLLWAALASLFFPTLLGLLPDSIWLSLHHYFEPWLSAELPMGIPYWLFSLQLFIFVVVAMIVQIPAIKMRLVPESIRHERARRHGHELFFIEGLHLTENRNGILFFVSEAERYVEIMVDGGIQQKIDAIGPDEWQAVVAEFVENVKQDRVFQGYEEAITACGELLIANFPANDRDVNELPDHLIEI